MNGQPINTQFFKHADNDYYISRRDGFIQDQSEFLSPCTYFDVGIVGVNQTIDRFHALTHGVPITPERIGEARNRLRNRI